uniref:Interleukin n=1 Tax=Mastacembelus armatus TaxID=205130 RepID=A0A3Q3M6M9_9TELE
MENFTNIAFWIAFFFGFVQVKSHPVLTDSKLNYMQENVICVSYYNTNIFPAQSDDLLLLTVCFIFFIQPTDSKFYAPANVEAHCITTALDCIMREFNGTVTDECEDPYEYIEQEVTFLDRKIKNRVDLGHVLTDSTECACEKWSEVPFSEFLKKANTFLEYVNAVSSQ